MYLPELTAWLDADMASLVSGTNLFYGVLPSTPDAAVVLYGYGGLPNEPVMGGTTIRMEFPRIQALARGVANDQDGPMLLMQQIIASFAKIGDQDLSGIRYHAVMALQPATKFRQDEQYRWEFICNFQVTKDWSTS